MCKQRSNERRYGAAIEVCTRPKVPEGSFCARCACEPYACLACRSKRSITQGICQKRWCAECCIDKQGITKQQYANAFGVHRFNRSWSSELRVTARLSFLLPWVLPNDASAFDELCVSSSAAPSGPCPGGSFTHVQLLARSLAVYYLSSVHFD